MIEAIKIAVACGVLLFAMRYFSRNHSSAALKLLFLLFFSRFVLAAFHQFTYPSMFGSMSLISLASLGSVALCFVLLPLVRPRDQSGLVILKSLIPIYCLIVLMVVSGLINGELKAAIPTLIKWVYLLQLVALLGYALSLDGLRATLKVLLIAYGFPVLMLLFSIALGVSKRNDLDGSTSYVGGFFHEAVFSTIIFSAAFFAVTCARRFAVSKSAVSLIVLLVSLVLIFFVNYRTTILALFAFCGVLVFEGFRQAGAKKKVVLISTAVCMLFWSSTFEFGVSNERFADLPNAFNNASELITYPENYTRDDRRLFSGRLYMWSAYISEANEGSLLEIIAGRGIDSWKIHFEKYAHNTFVSFYFELGLVGLLLCAWMFLGIYRRLKRVQDSDVRACGLAFLLGFLILNLGTMPLWSMEGIYCLACLVALGRHYSSVSYRVRPVVVAQC